MGFPSDGKNGEKYFRNPMAAVQRFLQERHAGHYRVYNVCCEPDRAYCVQKFGGSVVRFGWEDHNPPPLEMLLRAADDMLQWLAAHPQNVCAVHCKAGKGRTGTLICAYLCYAAEYPDAASSLAWYGRCRTANGQGVTIPSQNRYVDCFLLAG